MIFLTENIWFPPISTASSEGVLAIGGDLSSERLLLAYSNGIFPWFNEGEPVVWYSPDPRMVLFPERLKVSKSMRKIIRSQEFRITYNTHFEAVISNCKTIARDGQAGTWITKEMQEAYVRLHQLGIAKSVEVWLGDELVGGLYGVDLPRQKGSLGSVFCGESMFSKVSNASKIAFIYLVERLKKENYKLLDCQVYTAHLASLGAEEISREEFSTYLPSA